jgi:hypothetical protein
MIEVIFHLDMERIASQEILEESDLTKPPSRRMKSQY